MAETKEIQNRTYVVFNGNIITILTQYNGFIESQPFIKNAFITDTNGNYLGVLHKEGELIIAAVKYPSAVNFVLNTKTGELIISGENASKYSLVPETGELIYTE